MLFTQQADLRIRDIVDQMKFTIHLLLAIDKCKSINTYSVLIDEGHLVLCNPLRQKPGFFPAVSRKYSNHLENKKRFLVLCRGIDSEMVMIILIIKRKNSSPILSLIELDFRHGEQQKIGNKS
jgi:hypothetical protein